MKAYCTAQFKGWITKPGEIGLPASMVVTIDLVEIRKQAFEARMRGAKKSFIKDSGFSYDYMQKRVENLFTDQLTAWVWMADDQRVSDALGESPDSTVFHAKKGDGMPHTVCGILTTDRRIASGKQPVTCELCGKEAKASVTAAGPALVPSKDPKLMHVRSTEGPQIGMVQTLCGLTVGEKHTEVLHLVVRNFGKRVTCLACEFEAEALAEKSPSMRSGVSA